jgi:hypothetical protein
MIRERSSDDRAASQPPLKYTRSISLNLPSCAGSSSGTFQNTIREGSLPWSNHTPVAKNPTYRGSPENPKALRTASAMRRCTRLPRQKRGRWTLKIHPQSPSHVFPRLRRWFISERDIGHGEYFSDLTGIAL